MSLRKSNTKKFIKLFIFLILIVLLYFALIKREHEYWQENVRLSTGEKIDVKIDNSSTPILYGGHGLIIGAYFPKFKISFDYNGIKYNWLIKSYIEPILLNIYRGILYLVIYDGDGKEGDNFKLYRYSKKWEKIASTEFPNKIAVQNIFYLSDREIKESTFEMNPEDNIFKYNCLTPKLWLKLEKGVESYDWKKNEGVKKDFIIEYKKKYLGLSEKGKYSDIVFDEKIK